MIDSFYACPPIIVSLCESLTSAVNSAPLCIPRAGTTSVLCLMHLQGEKYQRIIKTNWFLIVSSGQV